jgi:endothelin-converting enzyme/putative endopeptidase
VGSQQDAQDSTVMIGEVIAGGLGLPDRDYYLDASADKEAIRQAYLVHLAAMFELLDEPAQQAAESAAAVMRIESALARASLTRVERRDPHKTYHRKSLEELQAMVPAVAWQPLFSTLGLDPLPWLNVGQPAFMAEVQTTLERELQACAATFAGG